MQRVVRLHTKPAKIREPQRLLAGGTPGRAAWRATTTVSALPVVDNPIHTFAIERPSKSFRLCRGSGASQLGHRAACRHIESCARANPEAACIALRTTIHGTAVTDTDDQRRDAHAGECGKQSYPGDSQVSARSRSCLA